MARQTMMLNSSRTKARRIGATHRDRIPVDVLQRLNQGVLETATLAEWLAVDMEVLLRAVVPKLPLGRNRAELLRSTAGVNALGVTRRLERIGSAIHAVTVGFDRREAVLTAIARHPSDIVRQWAAYAVVADSSMDIRARIGAIKPFAADRNMSVRECAWMAVRPMLVGQTVQFLSLVTPLAHDPDANVRRFASEVSRPRSVWCAHAPVLKKEPGLARDLLEPLRSDPSRYVQLSVGNWLNDASKTRPDWVLQICEEWSRLDDVPSTQHIVRRGLRSIRRADASAERRPRPPRVEPRGNQAARKGEHKAN